MNQIPYPNQSLTEQIVKKTLVSLERIDEFDSDSIDKIEEVVSKGDFKKAVEISKAIKPSEDFVP